MQQPPHRWCLEKRGYVLGRNLEFERRGAGGRFDLLLGLFDELVASTVDVILAIGYPAALPPTQRPAQRHCNSSRSIPFAESTVTSAQAERRGASTQKCYGKSV